MFKIAYRNTHSTSLNGYTGLEMIDMFLEAGPIPDNIIFSQEWIIHFHETKGNCVDKFTQHILGNDISTINYLFLYIKDRERLRSIENEYHSSVLFEQDFSDMTHIKETAQSIIDKINKFQEQITLADYTKL